MMRYPAVRTILALAVMVSAASSFAESSVQVSCQRGKCFLRDKQSLWNLQIKEGSTQSASIGDTVIGLGEGTAIEIEFTDGTRSYLRNSGLLKIEPGEKKSILAQGEENPESGAFTKNGARGPKENIFYVGTFAAKLLSPPVETPILSVKFPLTLTAAFSIEGVPDDERALMEWCFFPKGTTPSAEHRVQFRPIEAGSGNWSSELKVAAPGEYILAPQTMLKDGGFSIVVKSDENLESEVQGLLEKAIADPNATFEIRSGN